MASTASNAAAHCAHEAAALLAKAPSWTPALQSALARLLSSSPPQPILSQVLLHPLTPSPMACRLFLSHLHLAHTDPSLSRALAASLARPHHLHTLWPALRSLEEARTRLLPHFFVSLIASLGLAGLPLHAKQLFFCMPLFSCPPTLHTCNALLHALLSSPSSTISPSSAACQALTLFQQMPTMGLQPDTVIFNTILSGLVRLGQGQQALRIFSLMVDMGCKLNVVAYNVMIDWLAKQGKVDEALRVLQCMTPAGCPPNTITYNSLIDGLLKANHISKALVLLREMSEKGCNPHTRTCNALMRWFVKEGQIEAAMQLLGNMPSMGC
eukprot:c18466_g2_i1 orf=2-976(-)